jgi:hypothetical protein
MTKGSWKVATRNRRTVLIPDNPGEPAWAELVAWQAKSAIVAERHFQDLDRALLDALGQRSARWSATLAFTLDPPKGRAGRRDVDKLARSVLDALTGIVWADDEQVDRLDVRKLIVGQPDARERPGLVAVITLL